MYQDILNIAKLIRNSLQSIHTNRDYGFTRVNKPVLVMNDLLTVLYEKNKIAYLKKLNNPEVEIINTIPKLKLSNPGFIYNAITCAEDNYQKLNDTLNECISILNPVSYLKFTGTIKGNIYNGYYTYEMSKIGLLYINEADSIKIYGSNSAVLHSFTTIPTLEDYAIYWNTLKVPYDKRLVVETECLNVVKKDNGKWFFKKQPFY